MSEKLEALTQAMEGNPTLRAEVRQAVELGREGAADRLAQVAQSAGIPMVSEDFLPAIDAVRLEDENLEHVDGGEKIVVTPLGRIVVEDQRKSRSATPPIVSFWRSLWS